MKPFDPNHPRAIFPKYGRIVDDAMSARGLTAEAVAKTLGIDASAVRGYRRGFARNAPNRTAAFESILGVKLDFSEPTPSEVAASAAKASRDLNRAKINSTQVVLSHLSAIARAHGYLATFKEIRA